MFHVSSLNKMEGRNHCGDEKGQTGGVAQSTLPESESEVLVVSSFNVEVFGEKVGCPMQSNV